MATLQFIEIADLLNQSRTVAINLQPVKASAGNWELYEGHYQVHTQKIPFEVLYLQSKASEDSIRAAKRSAFKEKFTQVVYAPSLDTRLRQKLHETLFKESAASYWSTRDYLTSFINQELVSYKEKIKQLAPKDYEEPTISVPAGFDRKRPNPILSLFLDNGPHIDEESEADIGVVLAEPGQGKTYMTEHVAAELAKRKGDTSFPIYINSQQWASIAQEDLGSLWKTITGSFKWFGTPIPWIDGCEDKFLRVTLKAGIFRIIFDGFDEYVLRNRDSISADEVLRQISLLSAQTSAPIVVTSRTAFWNTEFHQLIATDTLSEGQLAAKISEFGQVSVYRIQPFNEQQAQNYFDRKLGKDNQRSRSARKVYRGLYDMDKDFAGRGFVLKLIADLFPERQTSELPNVPLDPISWVIHSHCQREIERQKLSLSANEQLQALQMFVFDEINGAKPTDDLLDLCLSIAAPNLDADTIRQSCQRMAAHALVTRLPNGSWQIRESQIRVALLAQYLLGQSENGDSAKALLARFSQQTRMDNDFADDLASMLVIVLRAQNTPLTWTDAVRSLVSKFIEADLSVQDSKAFARKLTTLAMQIAIKTVDIQLGPSASHLERATFLRGLFGTRGFAGLVFSGAMARMDFRGCIFSECRFENLHWANCEFDATTSFNKCHLIGGKLSHVRGFGTADWNQYQADSEGRRLLMLEQVNSGRRIYTADDLHADIGVVLAKFVGRGGAGLKSVKTDDLEKGKISASPHKKAILDEVKRRLLEAHHISGSGEGWKVTELASEDVRFYIQNNVFTGGISEVYEKLKLRLLT